jgi:hypothetical protein
MSQKQTKTLRGSQLDESLDRELASMLSDGDKVSPISIPALTTRLGLKSRSTLHTAERKAKIHAAIAKQRLLITDKVENLIRRKSCQEKMESLEIENAELKKKLNNNAEMLCRIVVNATAKGWDVDYLLNPLLKSRRDLIN